jgi:hypothetical protein
MGTDPLATRDREMLEKESSINADIIKERGYRTVHKPEELVDFGFNEKQVVLVPALLIPIKHVNPCPSENMARCVIRPHKPRITRDNKPIKYETPAGSRICLDIHPSQRKALEDAKTPLWITEGIKKGDSAASRGIACIALVGGVWGWGANSWLEDWNDVKLKDRRVYLVFDSDCQTNPSVEKALQRLTYFLKSQGARVSTLHIPSPDGKKIGLDDYFANGETVAELYKTAGKPAGGNAPKTIATDLVEILETTDGATLFHNPDGKPFVRIEGDTSTKVYRVQSSSFKQWLGKAYWDARRKTVNDASLNDALRAIAGKAVYEGEERQVFVRKADLGDKIYLDLANEAGEAVEIRKDGCSIIPKPPVEFIREEGMLPLPEPEEGGSLNKLREFLNVGGVGGVDDFPLLVSWLLAAIGPHRPYPILCLHGEQGCAKSTATRVLRRLIDPNLADLRQTPKEARELAIAANNSLVIAFDNLSGISPAVSDDICRLATGSGFSTRKLYSDSEETLFSAMRPIILNGISEVATRGDLEDRSIRIVLRAIKKEERKTERQFWSDFEKAQPQILGSLLDIVAGGLRELPNTKPLQLSRMADFETWINACEPGLILQEGLGWKEGLFSRVYDNCRNESNAVVLESSAVGIAIKRFMERRKEKSWKGYVGGFFAELEESADISILQRRDWPKGVPAFSHAIRRVAANLRQAGINIEYMEREKKGVPLRISLVPTRKGLTARVKRKTPSS